MFLYGLTPALQGFAARAMGGLDLSWLAGGLSAALTYAVLGGKVHRRYAAAATASGAAALRPDAAALGRGPASAPSEPSSERR